VHLYETTAGIVNLLRKANRSFGGVHLLDVTSAATGATCKFTDVSSASTWQIFPMFKFPFVLCAGCHRGSDRKHIASRKESSSRQTTRLGRRGDHYPTRKRFGWQPKPAGWQSALPKRREIVPYRIAADTRKYSRAGSRRYIDAFVEQSSLRNLSEHAILRFLEKRDHLFARNCRETFKEILDRISAFEVINQILDGHTRTCKARRAAHNLRVDFDD